MTANIRYNLIVGGATFLSVAAAFFLYSFLNGTLAGNNTIRVTVVFSDAHGVLQGGNVRMAGVDVGRVAAISLNADNEAEVLVRLGKRYPVPADSRFVVQGSVLGNTSLLNVVPGSPAVTPFKDGDRVRGELQGDLQGLLASGQTLIPELQKTLQSVQRITASSEKLLDKLNDPGQQRVLQKTLVNIEGITENLNRTTATLPRISQTAQGELATISAQSKALIAKLDAAATTGGRIARNGEVLTTNLNGTLQENRAGLKSLLESADESASALTGLLKQSGELLGDPDLKKNLLATTANLSTTTERLAAVTGNIEKLSSDPRLLGDLRDTVTNLKDTTQSIKNLAARVETVRIPGERRKPEGPQPSPAPPKPAAATALIEPGLAFDSLYDTTNPRFRADVNYTLRRGSLGRFYRAGVTDITENNGLNLQIGQSFGRNGEADFAYRYGLIGGKFGLGLDANLGAFDFRVDAYDPNRFTGNARAKLYLNRERTQSILFGVEDLARDNRATIGVQIRQ